MPTDRPLARLIFEARRRRALARCRGRRWRGVVRWCIALARGDELGAAMAVGDVRGEVLNEALIRTEQFPGGLRPGEVVLTLRHRTTPNLARLDDQIREAHDRRCAELLAQDPVFQEGPPDAD